MHQHLAIAKGDGRYPKLLAAFARTNLIVLDDWGTATLTDQQRRDLFEILEDRYDRHSTLIAAVTADQALARHHRQSHAR